MGGRRSYKSNNVVGSGSKGFRKTKKDILTAIEEEDSKKIVENSAKAILDSEKQRTEFKDLLDNLSYAFNSENLDKLEDKEKSEVTEKIKDIDASKLYTSKKDKKLLDEAFDDIWGWEE